jgi:regulator of protease activity HflC (stomatin/prohibitin superfamily)
MNSSVKLVASGILVAVLLVVGLCTVRISTIEGNELGIMETWSEGVVTNIMQPKTYFLIPGFNKTVYTYDASSKVFVMNDKPEGEEKESAGRELDAYLVQSQEGQDMKISLNLRWRIDPSKLVDIHKTVRNSIEDKIIRPVVMRVVKDKATRMKAIDAYSGDGLVKLQSAIQTALSGGDPNETDELRDRGVIVENFVIEHIELDARYIEEIKQKQLATQRTLRAAEEQRAADAEALVAKAKAQADLNKAVVEAQRDKEVQVLKAEADQEKVVLAAKADAEKAVLAAKADAEKVTLSAQAEAKKFEMEGEGKKLGMIAIAQGTLAEGKAKAEAQELLLKAYNTTGAEAWVKVQVAQHVAEAFKGIKGYLPGDMNMTLLTGNFQQSVDALTGNAVIPITTTNSPIALK